jgi:hypothetical protein
VRRIVALEVEEVSLVSKGANPGAKILLLKSAGKAETKPTGEVTRAEIDALDEAYEVSERALKRCGRSVARAYDAYNAAVRDVIARRKTAEAGALSILSVTKSEL